MANMLFGFSSGADFLQYRTADMPAAACRGLPQARLCRVFPNASAKQKGERGTFLGEAMLGMKDVGALALRRPVDRGFVVAWDLQREILAR